MVSNTENQYLQDVIIDILSRLPVKSLLRFRCVCKYWASLTSSPSFSTKHHDNNNSHLLVLYYDYVNTRYAFALFPDETLSSVPLAYHDLLNFQMPRNPGVFGPVNGLFGLWERDRIALWNPALRELKPLPVPLPDHLSPPFKSYCHFFGFGLDPTNGNYKLVFIRYFWDEKDDNPYGPIVISVYNLCNNSWRVFEEDFSERGFVQDSLCNTYVNGVYYWLTSDNDPRYMILSFDMSNEVFRSLTAPPDIPKSHGGHLSLYNNSIAMILYDANADEKCFDIWVMKEENCWIKQYTAGPLVDIDRPLGLWKNGELFLEGSSKLLLYNHSNQETKDLGLRGKDFCFRVVIYKESIVPIKGWSKGSEGDNLFGKVQVQDFFTYEPHVMVLKS